MSSIFESMRDLLNTLEAGFSTPNDPYYIECLTRFNLLMQELNTVSVKGDAHNKQIVLLECAALLAQSKDNYVSAIRMYRERTGECLLDSKQIIDSLQLT